MTNKWLKVDFKGIYSCVTGIICSKTTDNEYLNYQFQYFQKSLEHFAPGAQKNIGVEFLTTFPVIVPVFKEQQAISSAIRTWDKAIEKTTQLITAKEQRKKWMMQQLLGGTKRLKEFTDKWEEVKMSDIFDRVARRNTELNSTVVTYPWGATKRLNDFDKAVVTTLYICFGIKDYKKYSGEFFEHFFESGILDEGLIKIAHEGGRAHGLLNVTPTDFLNLKITIPEVEEQKAIANILQTAIKK